MTDEIDQQDRIAHDDPGKRDEPDHRRRGERRTEEHMAKHNPDQRQRYRRQDHQRQLEALELTDHQYVDRQQRDHEGRAHVAEGNPGDFPLAVPQQGGVRFIVGLAVKADPGLLQPVRPPVVSLHRLVDGDHAVDRGFISPGELRGDHRRTAAVPSENRLISLCHRCIDDLPKLDQLRPRRPLRHGHRCGGEGLGPGAV